MIGDLQELIPYMDKIVAIFVNFMNDSLRMAISCNRFPTCLKYGIRYNRERVHILEQDGSVGVNKKLQ